MELQKKHLGSKIFIKSLAREVEVCEENKLILLQHNFKHLFVLNQPVKTTKPKAKKVKKLLAKKEENDSTGPISDKDGEYGIESDNNNS